MTELEEIHSYKLEQRLANFLLLYASSDAKVEMTQQEIASHLGTTREVIARIVGKLASEKHIETSRNQIAITDPPKLAELVRGIHSKSKERKWPNKK